MAAIEDARVHGVLVVARHSPKLQVFGVHKAYEPICGVGGGQLTALYHVHQRGQAAGALARHLTDSVETHCGHPLAHDDGGTFALNCAVLVALRVVRDA